MKKRLLAMLLVLMLVVGLLPVGVLADANDTEFHIVDMDTLKQFVAEARNEDTENVYITGVYVNGYTAAGKPASASGGITVWSIKNVARGDLGYQGSNGLLASDNSIWKVLNDAAIINQNSVQSITVYARADNEGPVRGRNLEPITLYLSEGSIETIELDGKLITQILLDEASLEPPEEVEYSYTINYYFVDSAGNVTKSSTVDTVKAEAISNSTIQYKAANELEGYQTDVTYVLDDAKSSDSFVWTADKQVFEVYYAVDGNNNETPDYEEEPTETRTIYIYMDGNGTATAENYEFTTDSTVDSFKVTVGEDATIVFAPKEGYAFSSMYVDGNSHIPAVNDDGTVSYTFANVVEDHQITVRFQESDPTPTPDEKTYTLKYVASSDNLNESLVLFYTPVPSQQQGISTTGSYTFTVADSVVETAKGGINYTYGFLGWSTEPLGDSAEDVDYNPGDEITVSEDTTLYGVWERLFLVKYSTGDVDYFTTEEYYCSLGSDTPDFQQEAVVNVTTAYDKDNDQYYVFTGWSPAVTDTVTNSVEYKAQWRTKQFAVQFKIDPDDKGGELSSDGFDVDYEDEYWKHVNYKTEIRVGVDSEPISDQEGYKYFYNGWTAETADGDDITTTNIKESSANEVLFVMPAEDAVVTIHYELKADFNNNNVPDEEEYLSISYEPGCEDEVSGMPTNVTNALAGNEYTVSKDVPTRYGYVFDGWATDDVIVDNGKFTMPNTNVTFTAIWKETTLETQPVVLQIYQNGDTKTPVKSITLDNIQVGGQYSTTEDYLNELVAQNYTPAAGATGDYVVEGYYNDGGWNDYIGGNPDNTLDLSEPITVNGWYNIKCMVTDYEPVVVYGVTDGDKDNAEQLWSGKALHGSNLIAFLEENEAGMNLERTGYIRDQWYNWDWYGNKFADDSTVNGWTNVYVTYTSDWQPIHVVIYKNGNTSEPVVDVAIDSLRKGETLDTTKLDISEYYTPDKFATGFDYEGWFNDGAWNDYKGDGCPEDATGLNEIYINGWTNVIAMVWDQFPVNYHVLDESGEEVDSHSENRTVRDLNDDFWWPTVDAGYAFDGWYEKAEDIGNESKQEGLPLALKKYELYGELVSLVPEEGPNEGDLAQLTVRVNDNKNAPVNHGGKNLDLIEGCYDIGKIVEKDGIYTVTVTPIVAEYAKQYDIAQGFAEGSHTATTSQSKVHSFVFTWTDGEWVLTSDDSVTIGVKCSVTVPTPDELAELLQIRVKDYAGAEELPVGVTAHGQFVTGILEGTYSITGPTAENNTFVATVTLTDGSAYAAAYDENRQLEAGTHALTTTVSKLDPITLTYDFTTGTWSASNTGWSLGVKCEQVIYTIHVSFVGPNGEAYGGGDVISTMPDVSVEIADPVAEGKTFVGWKKLVGLEEIYNGEFTYTALAALVGDNFTPDTHETWLEFEAVFEDETVEPDPYNTIHVSFVGPNGEAYGGGDVISTMPDVSVEIADPVAEGKTFVGWKKLVGLEEIYNGEFTYTALAALVGDNFTPDTHEAWLTFEAVFEDETVEPDPYYIINIRFVDSDGTTSLGGGDVISTSPDAAYPSVPSPVAPQGMEFVGWKVWLGNEPMYEGKFTYNALKALREELDGEITWVDGRTWITFQAVYEDVTVEPDPGVTGFTKALVTDRDLYNARGIAYPDFYRGTVIVDEGDRVTLIYNITVKGTAGTEFTVRDDSADFAQTGVIPSSGETSFYVAKTFSWRDVRNAGDTLDNTASVSVDGETVKTDTERVPVDIDWDINVPDIDDDDDDDVAEPDDEYIPNWLNTTDHYSYIVGYEDGTIRPGNNITRAEVATIFFRLLSEGSSERWYSASNRFSDVAADSWYNVPVSTLSNMGIIDGYEDGTFKPNAPITRAEFTAIATRFFDYTAEYEGAFNDVTYSDWYADCVQAAVDMGLVNGYADGGFRPNAYITRAESCAIVNRVLNRVPHEDYLLDEDEMITWPDNSYGAWYYADMQEATNSHDYDWIRVSGEVVEEWTDKLAEPNW